MRNITFFVLDKYKDANRYQFVEKLIYEDKNDGSYRLAMKFEIEENETFNGQYPLEDILDHFTIHVEDSLDELNTTRDNPKIEYLELGGSLDEIREVYSQLNNKRAYNEEIKDENNEDLIYSRLVIE